MRHFEPTTQLKVSVSPLHPGVMEFGSLCEEHQEELFSLVTHHLLNSKEALEAEKDAQQCRPSSRPTTLVLNNFSAVHISKGWEKRMI